MRSSVIRGLLAAFLILSVATPAAQAEVGPDYVSSDNVTLTARIKTVGDGVGGRVVGNYLYVTSTKSLSIFDIKANPANPPQVGIFTLDVEWENEEVPTNGKVLGISASSGCKDPLGIIEGSPRPPSAGEANCLNLYDVRDPANVKFIRSVPGSGEHVSACVLDCSYFYGDNGSITDARDPKTAKLIAGQNFITNAGVKTNCHAVREIADGIIFGSCQPLVLWSVRPEHGGSITKPAVLAVAKNSDNRFIHSNRWPRLGLDKFALVGGEKNAQPQCSDQVSAFMVWDATPALNPDGTFKKDGTFKLLDEVRPKSGTYTDGRSPYNALGCSVHWFQEHPEFRNGGLVALAEYEQGTRFLQITPAGKIIEQGYFLPLGGSASSALWNPDGKHIYNIDYTRGIDVLKWSGPSYRGGPDAFNPGNAQEEPGTTPGTQGKRDEKAIEELKQKEAEQRQANQADCSLILSTATAKPRGKGLALSAGGARFDAQVFQVSRGSSILRKKRVARFSGATGEKVWNGKTPRRKATPNGFYIVRISSGGKARQIVVQRRGGKFVVKSDFQTGSSCGALRSYQLRSPVFGGKRNVGASVAFRLTQNADSVRIEAVRGTKVVKTVTKKDVAANKTVKVAVPARGLKRGTLSFRIVVVRGNNVIAQTTLDATRV